SPSSSHSPSPSHSPTVTIDGSRNLHHHCRGTHSLSVSGSRGNHSVTASTSVSKKSPTKSFSPTPTFTCTGAVHLAVRAQTELFGYEHQWCLAASNHTPANASSCVVIAPSTQRGSQQMLIDRNSISSVQIFPLYLVLPFVLNATDWAIEKAHLPVGTPQPNTGGLSKEYDPLFYLDNATFEQARLTQMLEQQLSLAYPGQNGTTGAVVFRFDSTPPYGSVHTV
ncbi:Hypothetical protein, putative, partial [Bodo saltans]